MRVLMVFLLLSVMVLAVLSASIPVNKLVEDNQSSYSNPNIRVLRSPKKGEIAIKIEKNGQLTSINLEGKQTVWEGKYGKVDIGGSLVKTPDEQTKGKLSLEAKFEWDK